MNGTNATRSGLAPRVGARRHGLPDLSACDRHHHHDVEGRCRLGRPCRHGNAAFVCDWRLARRLYRRSCRPGQDASVYHPLVLGLLAGLRDRAELRSAADCTGCARAGLWRRMGGGRRADGRSDPPAISRPRGRLGAIGLGGRLGTCRALAGRTVFQLAARDRLALDVCDRRSAGAAGFYLRRYVSEPEIAAAARAKQAAAGDQPSIWEIFSGPILKTTILASLMATGCQGGYYAITFWVPRFLTTERKLSIVSSTGYLSALIIGSFIGYLVGAWLADRIGRRNLFLIFSIGAIAVVLLYTQLTLPNEASVGARLPAWLFCIRLFLRHGRVPHRALSRRGCADRARVFATISAGALARCSRSWSARCRTPRRSPMPSRSSRSRPTPCSSSPPLHCRKRAAACCTPMD